MHEGWVSKNFKKTNPKYLNCYDLHLPKTNLLIINVLRYRIDWVEYKISRRFNNNKFVFILGNSIGSFKFKEVIIMF